MLGTGMWGVRQRHWGMGCGVWDVGCGIWGVGCKIRHWETGSGNLGSVRWETDSGKQELGNGKRATGIGGNGRWGNGNRELGNGNGGTGEWEPGTGSREPGAGHRNGRRVAALGAAWPAAERPLPTAPHPPCARPRDDPRPPPPSTLPRSRAAGASSTWPRPPTC